VSDDAKEKAKENAEALLEELKAGGDAASLAQKYGVSNYYFERTGYVGSFTDSVNKAVENLKAGECSGVLEEELGYAVIHMKSDHDEELLKNYAYAVASDTVDSQFEKLETQWLSSIEVDPEKDMEGTVWADYDLSGLAQSLADGGLLNGASSTSSAGSN
jgi:parvulin-like peptidyl-prolyl isomerase